MIDEDEISKRLKTLPDMIQNKEKLSTVNAVDFAVIAIFIDCEQKKETMKKLAHLFSQIEKIEPHLQLDLHHILKKMIKKHFEDYENKCKELLKMISKSVYRTNYEGLTYKERTELINKEIEKRKDKQHKQEIQQKDQEIEKLKQQLAKQNQNNIR